MQSRNLVIETYLRHLQQETLTTRFTNNKTGYNLKQINITEICPIQQLKKLPPSGLTNVFAVSQNLFHSQFYDPVMIRKKSNLRVALSVSIQTDDRVYAKTAKILLQGRK